MTQPTNFRTALVQALDALRDAQQSLETISTLAGRATYGNPPIETFMQHHDEVRAYAKARAGCAAEALTAGRAALAHPPVKTNSQDQTLVERLRDTASKGVSAWGDLQMEAANEIEILTAEREAYASSMDRMKAAMAQPQGETCPTCGTHEIEFVRLCHNSACSDYATGITTYQGWNTHPQASEPAQGDLIDRLYATIIQWDEGGGKRSRRELARRIFALQSTAQPVGELTDEQIDAVGALESDYDDPWQFRRMARAILAAAKAQPERKP